VEGGSKKRIYRGAIQSQPIERLGEAPAAYVAAPGPYFSLRLSHTAHRHAADVPPAALYERAIGELRSSRAYYVDLFDHAPIGYCAVDGYGTIRHANLAVAGLLRLPREIMVGMPLGQFVATSMRDEFERFLKQLPATGAPRHIETMFVASDVTPFFAHIQACADPGKEEVLLVICDISERRQAELALVESEERFRRMADFAPVLLWVASADGRYLWFNRMWLEFTGRPLEQEIGPGWAEGVHPDDRESCMKSHADAFASRRPFTLEYRLRNRDGSYRYVLVNGAPRMSGAGQFTGYIGSCTDISERRKTEEALHHSRQMLRHLVSYQERVREDERKRIAREIHDDLGQNLLALRIDVAMLHKRTGSSHPKLNERVSIALNHIDATMKAVRAAINNLRPTVLDLGLNAAIEWQVEDFQRRSGIECKLLLEEEFSVDDDCATALFRILQESLNNVLRHAQASGVRIALYRRDGNLFMKIEDNGIGLYPDCRRKANSFGLIGIEERINALGGELVIESNRQQGTALIVSIPLR
jgi:PAS domain S-box-containing protein